MRKTLAARDGGPKEKAGSPRLVATLLGHAHVEMALSCLGSLLRRSAEPLKLRVHDDGTLTPEDCDRLAAGLAAPEFVARQEADERVGAALAGHPALLEFRRGNPLALKLLDAPLLAEGGELAYCDSDVLFLRPFKGLFRFPDQETGTVFMSDLQCAYSVRSWHLLRHRRLALPYQINTGIILFQTRLFDLDLLEWYLSRPEFGFAPVWTEQTAWALLGARSSCRLWDPLLVRLPGEEEEEPGRAVALHFVNPLRGLLPRFMERACDGTDEPPVVIGTVPTRRCHPWDLAWIEMRRRLARS